MILYIYSITRSHISVTQSCNIIEEHKRIVLYHISIKCYDSIILGLIKERNLILELTQENSIENSVQDCLPYILNYNGLYYYLSSLS